MAEICGKNVLITGGAGFIGSHLCDLLLDKQAKKVVVVDNFFLGKIENVEHWLADSRFVLYRDDARQFGVMLTIMEREAINVVFNLATIALNYSFINPFDAYMENVEIANILLQLQYAGKFQTLIHLSSSEAYGTAQYSPMDEKHPLNPTTPYAAGKLAADLLIESFWKVNRIDAAIIRPFNNYGPRQNMDGPLAGIIPRTINRIMQNLPPEIEGDGEQTRDFVFVKDTARGILLAYENEQSRRQIINLGTGKEISMSDLVGTICKQMDYKGIIDRKPERCSDVRRLCASSDKARQLLEFEVEYPFDEGLKETLRWYMALKSN